MTLATARPLFFTAALFNWAAVLLFLPVLGLASQLGIEPAPTGTIVEQIALLAIFLFGLGYWMVGSSPTEHRGIITLGLLGKLGVGVIVGAQFLTGSANLAWVVVASGDLIFAGLFWHYLSSTRARHGHGFAGDARQ